MLHAKKIKNKQGKGNKVYNSQNKHMDAGIRNSRIGMILAFIISMTAIIGGVICILFGNSAEGIASIITALASLFGTYVYGKYKEKKESDQKFNDVLNNQFHPPKK